PLKRYQQHLPHLQQDGATYFVTFRLHDSLPQTKLRELRLMKDEWEKRHPPPRTDEQHDQLKRESMRRVEAWLDQGMGSCILKDERLSSKVVDAMQKGDGDSHELGCYVVMPNHVHATVRPLAPVDDPLESILQRWKGGSSYEINRCVQRLGTLWE